MTTSRRLPGPALDIAVIAASLLDVWVHVHCAEPLRLAAGLLAAFSLALRRHLPLATFALTLPTTLVTDAVFATLAALYSLAVRTRHRWLLAGCAIAFTVSDTTSWNWPSPEFGDPWEPWTIVSVSYALGTAAAPVFLGQLVQAKRELSLRLVEISRAREHERLLTAQSVLAKERAQLAREMHDVVSHQVSLIAVRAGSLQVSSRDPETKGAAATIRQLSVRTLDELRHMVSVLRASESGPAELTPQPSLADLERLVLDSGIEADLCTDLPGDLPATVQRAVYRTVQEALTNVRKHAPGASATIRVRHEDGVVHAVVTNTPSGRPALPLPGAHHGLVGLRQRAELLGGTVTAGSTPDGGYELHLSLPAPKTS
ncbi:sensor histidine kinase [Streptomyces minutiscleroticus]|uniref:histidine kinase n=1 Tax=Streptomyces minutiscleroticus TaxID=68238 RepID=A0A918KRD3_9ACTN|nr:sensor histidine kinase [Streptomyces minutiscleroticus]GGX73097.1 two-component sensor histidine kinase [Streptomyces minutiscleroticus]